MKQFLILAISAMFAQTLLAADLTGHWVASQPGRGGQPQETSIWIKASGDTFAGYMNAGRNGNVPIVDGKVTGDQIAFTTVTDNYGEERRAEYTGSITPEGLIIRPPAGGGRGAGGLGGPGGMPPGGRAGTANGRGADAAGRGAGGGGRGQARELLAKRISSDVPPPMPEKVDLGPMKEVKHNALAKTPPMGWNSWNKFRNQVSDKLVREVADGMVRNGLKDAGYVYVNIDDTWQGPRDANGNITTNERFPDMKALGDYLHSTGLKFGIYSSPGPTTCAGYPGSYQHEVQDAKTYASWGIDYLKYDWCSGSAVYKSSSMPAAYAKMGQALLDSGRPILYSLCQYGVMKVYDWGAKAGGNAWRTTGDIRDAWASMAQIGFDQQQPYQDDSGPGHWNDPDMLEVGNGGMSEDEYRTHMSLWCLLAAPLLAGNDLRDASPNILAILTNKEVIAIDQDKMGKQARRASKNGDLEIWTRPLERGGYAVGMFNRGESPAKMTLHPADLNIKKISKIRDLWAHTDDPAAADFSADVPSHGVVMLRVEGK
jgi:alpha-galactosidase